MSPLNLSWVLLLIGWSSLSCATPKSRFECLRDLLPVTNQAYLHSQRKGFEEPFLSGSSYIVFPAVAQGVVVGFYVYDEAHAWHYDAIDGRQPIPIRTLGFDKTVGILDMFAQPNGLETLTVAYLPGFSPRETLRDGPVMLGSSVLPVIGGLVSRPQKARMAYIDPEKAAPSQIRSWFRQQAGPGPWGADKGWRVQRTLRRLRLAPAQTSDWVPLDHELKLRVRWIKSHNLDEKTFRQLNRVMQSSCVEK